MPVSKHSTRAEVLALRCLGTDVTFHFQQRAQGASAHAVRVVNTRLLLSFFYATNNPKFRWRHQRRPFLHICHHCTWHSGSARLRDCVVSGVAQDVKQAKTTTGMHAKSKRHSRHREHTLVTVTNAFHVTAVCSVLGESLPPVSSIQNIQPSPT